MKIKPIKVTLLNQYIKKYLSSNSIFNNLRVEGEISNLKISKTGYTYFTLCDENSCVSCVCFYAENMCKDGDKIIVDGELSVYEVRGTYQIIVRSIEKTGLGKMLQDLEILKEKLKSKGMFEKHKELPLYPRKIGVVTSKSGAAIMDILKTFESVSGDFEVIVYNALVQGDKSVQSITAGIRYFNKEEITDIILISRGGGSFEDLNIFNNVEIAEEAFLSTIPVITGIGHETDRTLLDYVADMYSHTPTAAAEYIMRGYRELPQKAEKLLYKLKSQTLTYLKLREAEIKTSKYILKSYLPIENIYREKSQLENYKYILKNNIYKKINDMKVELEILHEKVTNNNYALQLERGFSVVTDQKGEIIRDINQVKSTDMLKILFKDFIVTAEIKNIKEVKHG